MTGITRRSILVASLIAPMAHIPLALAVDALPDARFVGFAQAVNDFDLASGQMALQRSANENIRGYATRIIADANYDASALSKSSAEAGVSYAPDGSMGPKTKTSWPSSTRCRARRSTRPSPRASSRCRSIARRSTAPIRRTARAVRSSALPRTPCPRRRNAWTWRAGWPAAAESCHPERSRLKGGVVEGPAFVNATTK